MVFTYDLVIANRLRFAFPSPIDSYLSRLALIYSLNLSGTSHNIHSINLAKPDYGRWCP